MNQEDEDKLNAIRARAARIRQRESAERERRRANLEAKTRREAANEAAQAKPEDAERPKSEPPDRPKSNMRANLFGAFCAAAFVWYMQSGEPDKPPYSAPQPAERAAPAPPPPPKPMPAREVHQTTARELFKLYEENELTVQNYMQYVTVKMTGDVQSVSLDVLGNAIVELETPNRYMPARLRLREDAKPAAASLRKGQPVTVTCEKMERLMGAPYGSDCRIP